MSLAEEIRDLRLEIDWDGDSSRLGDVRQCLDASLHVISLGSRQPLAARYAEGTLTGRKTMFERDRVRCFE